MSKLPTSSPAPAIPAAALESVAAALAGLMVARDIPDSELIVTTVAVAIVLTLAVQTTTKTWLGRRLELEEGP